ncbi:MAG: hypothetical protein CW342_05485 [Thermoactinomycetaceae bacterium]|nr:hypothetical protein [Bacillota bacterium]MBO2532332.1 hypothetical protein [Thermoactinomycetaceae bacterium]
MRRDEDAKENGEFFMPKREKTRLGNRGHAGIGQEHKIFPRRKPRRKLRQRRDDSRGQAT